MNPLYDLTKIPQLDSFPWEAVYVGLAQAHKSVTTFYGDTHSTQYQSTSAGWKDKNSWRWYNALKHGVSVEGFNVNLNSFIGHSWWARIHEPNIWKPTENWKLFEDLRQWIENSGIFSSTGRILFFVQLAGQGSPQHTDFDPLDLPYHLRKPSEFIWLTPPDNPKLLTVNGEQAPWCCWFNHFLSHGSQATDRPQWSLRIDGIFTPEFKRGLE